MTILYYLGSLWYNKLFLLIIVLTLLLLLAINYSRNTEKFETSFVLDNIIVNESCKNITPIQLFKLFNNDIDLMTNTLLQNGFSSSDLSQIDNYPKIATFLENKKIISC